MTLFCATCPHPPAQIALWSIEALRSSPSVRPCVLTAIPAGDVQFAVRFNMNDVREIITNGKRRVYFWSHQVCVCEEGEGAWLAQALRP